MQVKINVIRNTQNGSPLEQSMPMTQLPSQSQLVLSPLFAHSTKPLPLAQCSSPERTTKVAGGPTMAELQQQTTNLLTPIAVLSQVNSTSTSPPENCYFAMGGGVGPAMPIATSATNTAALASAVPQQASSNGAAATTHGGVGGGLLTQSQKLPSLQSLPKRPYEDFAQPAGQQVSNSTSCGLQRTRDEDTPKQQPTAPAIGSGGRWARGVIAASAKAVNSMASPYLGNQLGPSSTDSLLEPVSSSGAKTQKAQQLGPLQNYLTLADTASQSAAISSQINHKNSYQEFRNHTQPLSEVEEGKALVALQPHQIGKKRALRATTKASNVTTARLAYLSSLTSPQLREKQLSTLYLKQQSDQKLAKDQQQFSIALSKLGKGTGMRQGSGQRNHTTTVSPLGNPIFKERSDMLRSSETNYEEKNDEKAHYDTARVKSQKKKGGILNEDLMLLSQDHILRELSHASNPSSSATQPSGANEVASTKLKGSRNVHQELLLPFNSSDCEVPADQNEAKAGPYDYDKKDKGRRWQLEKQSLKANRPVLSQDYNFDNMQQQPQQIQQQQQQRTVMALSSSGGLASSKPHFKRRFTKGLNKCPAALIKSKAQADKENAMTFTSDMDMPQDIKQKNGHQRVPNFVNLHQQHSHTSLSSIGSMIMSSQQQQSLRLSAASPQPLPTRQELQQPHQLSKPSSVTLIQKNNLVRTRSQILKLETPEDRKLQITGFSDNSLLKSEESSSIADFIESTIQTQKEADNNCKLVINSTGQNSTLKKSRIQVFKYLESENEALNEEEEGSQVLMSSPRSQTVLIEEIDTPENTDQHRETIQIEYPDSLVQTDENGIKSYRELLQLKKLKESDQSVKGEQSSGKQANSPQSHQKDLQGNKSRNSITMRESIDFAYSESNMQSSSYQKTQNMNGHEGTINQTPSSIDFKLTTKDDQSPTPLSQRPTSSAQKKLDALHSLASIQAYMQKQQISEFNSKPSCESLRLRKIQKPTSNNQSPSDQFLNRDLYDITADISGQLNHFLDKELEEDELRLKTPLQKEKFRKSKNRTSLKLGGNFTTLSGGLNFDDEIQLREPEKLSMAPKNQTAIHASEMEKEMKNFEMEAYCNVASLALQRQETLSLCAAASPPNRRESVSRNTSISALSKVESFSGNENSTPSDIMLDSKDVYSNNIDSPTSIYFKTSPEVVQNSPRLLSPKDKLGFKINLLRMCEQEEEETKAVTTDQSTNEKSHVINTPPYNNHFKFNRSLDSSKSTSKLTITDTSSTPKLSSASPLWKQKSVSPKKSTLPKIFVPRSSQEGIQGLQEQHQEAVITKDKFSRCSNFLKQKQPAQALTQEQSSPDSKMVAISPSKHMLEAQQTKNMSQFSGKQALMNTRPMFISRPIARKTSLTNSDNQPQTQQTNHLSSNSGFNEYSPDQQYASGPRKQERLESLEMREAIYESHGIMTSAEKQKTQSALFGIGQRGHRKALSFAYDSTERADQPEKLTFPSQSSNERQQATAIPSPPLTVRNQSQLKKEEQLIHDLQNSKASENLQSIQRLNQLMTTKKIKEKSKGHGLLTLKREEILRVNSTTDLGTVSPKFVQITKVKVAAGSKHQAAHLLTRI